jgi:hypothetical protein
MLGGGCHQQKLFSTRKQAVIGGTRGIDAGELTLHRAATMFIKQAYKAFNGQVQRRVAPASMVQASPHLGTCTETAESLL